MAADTHPDAERVLRERRIRMTPGERVEEGLRASLFCRHVMRAGIRGRHPDYSEADVEAALERILWGDALYRAARPSGKVLEP